jgi:predicted 3-demethylubiquinone-9 3-methyltransferase (glyoxalase superfamily)
MRRSRLSELRHAGRSRLFLGETSADGGQESQCGWLKDKFGVSWQIVPTILIEMLQDKDSEKSERVMKAMLQMQKIDIKTLKEARAEVIR